MDISVVHTNVIPHGSIRVRVSGSGTPLMKSATDMGVGRLRDMRLRLIEVIGGSSIGVDIWSGIEVGGLMVIPGGSESGSGSVKIPGRRKIR
jgi:hypothetical protein